MTPEGIKLPMFFRIATIKEISELRGDCLITLIIKPRDKYLCFLGNSYSKFKRRKKRNYSSSGRIATPEFFLEALIHFLEVVSCHFPLVFFCYYFCFKIFLQTLIFVHPFQNSFLSLKIRSYRASILYAE